MSTLIQCHQRVPQALWPYITAPPRCTLATTTGVHHGDHRASYNVLNVGKIMYRWKGMKKGRARPDVKLPTATASHINPARGSMY